MPDINEWDIEVLSIYRDVIGQCDPDEGTTKGEAKMIAARRVRDLVEAGELEVPVDLAISASIDRADSHDGGVADKVIARTMRGEDALGLEDDPNLDVVVVLGEGRRKPLRYVNRDDLLSMDALRYRNMRAAATAYDEWRETFEQALAAIIAHGTFGDAAESGAFTHGAAA